MEVKNVVEECVECNKTLMHVFDEKTKFENIVSSLSIYSPQMMWIKDLDGKYVFATSPLVSGLLFSGSIKNTLGKTDLELAKEHRDKPSARHHTVGAICADSDQIVLRYAKPMKFIEQFMVDGKPLVLDVRKNVVRNTLGEVIGTVGTAVDITDDFMRLNALLTEDDMPDRFKECIRDVLYKDYLEAEDGQY